MKILTINSSLFESFSISKNILGSFNIELERVNCLDLLGKFHFVCTCRFLPRRSPRLLAKSQSTSDISSSMVDLGLKGAKELHKSISMVRIHVFLLTVVFLFPNLFI